MDAIPMTIPTMQRLHMPPSVSSETAALTSLLHKFADMPNPDFSKIEHLLKLYEQMSKRAAEAAFNASLAELQPKLPIIGRHGEIKGNDKNDKSKQVSRNKYALYEDIVESCRPLLSEHGFSERFEVEQTEAKMTVTCVLGHSEGFSTRTSISLPFDSSPGKNNNQGWGSTLSYGKRYSYCAALNIITRGEDDDGKAGGADETVSDEQQMALREKIEVVEADIPRFCQYFQIEKLPDLPAKRFDEAMNMLGAKK